MRSLTNTIRCLETSARSVLLVVSVLTLATAAGFAGSPGSETIHANYSQNENTIGLTLIVYGYSTSSDLALLSSAFKEGRDQGLATALSKTKAAGQCTIEGSAGYDVAFIQMVPTPSGRRITFIANRPHRFEETEPPALSQAFDLAVGQFDLNDTDPAKSTGFLYPASRLIVDEDGESHYDLAGNPLVLINILDSNETTVSAEPRVAVATGPDVGKDHSRSNAH